MSSKILASHLFGNFTFCDHNTLDHHFCFSNSSRPCCLSVSEHSCNQIKLNFFHLSANHRVAKVLCFSSKDHQEDGQTPPKSHPSEWKKWTLGFVLAVILPSFGHKMGPLLLLKSKVDMAVERVEEVTELVEEVAEATEELAEKVEEKLPENSILKKDLDILENLSEKAVKEAKQAEKLLHQIQDVEKELTESLTGPGSDQLEVVNQGKRNKDDGPVK